VNSDDNRARCGSVGPYPRCHIDHYGAITNNGIREGASKNKAEGKSWRGQRQNTILVMGEVDRVKILQKFSRCNSRRDVIMCLIFRKITLSQPRNVLVIEVLKYCDVLGLGFVQAGKDKGEVNGI
jgi:hypothetical protein